MKQPTVVTVWQRGLEPETPATVQALSATAQSVWGRRGWAVRELRAEPRVAPPGLDAPQQLGWFGAIVADAVARGVVDGPTLVLGGNCTVLPGVLAGLQRAFGAAARIGLVWLDAHGDCNTPQTTRSGMLGGMPVAVGAGLCHAAWREAAGMLAPLPTDRMVLVDGRNLDPEEAQLLRWIGIPVVPARPDALAGVVAALAQRVDMLVLHIDLDVLDAALTPTHPTREPGGLDLASVRSLVEVVVATGGVRVLSLVSVYADGPGGDVTLASAQAVLEGALNVWP